MTQATALSSLVLFGESALRPFVIIAANSYNLARFANMPRRCLVQYPALANPINRPMGVV
jgi:hypothetical protein